MSKKMLKRSLALGALMAFVITGSAMSVAEAREYKQLQGVTGSVSQNVSGTNDSDRVVGGYYVNAGGDNVSSVTNAINSNLTVNGGDWNMMVGGNYIDDYVKELEVAGVSTSMIINNGVAEQVVGGSVASGVKNTSIKGTVSTNLIINGGSFGGAADTNCPELFVAGGDLLKYNAIGSYDPNSGANYIRSNIVNTNVTINDGEFDTAIVGGSIAVQNYSHNCIKEITAEVGTATTNINGGTFKNHPIFAGGMAHGNQTVSTVGNAILNIKGIETTVDVYAGGVSGNGSTSMGNGFDKQPTATITNGTTIEIENATVGNIYGTNGTFECEGSYKWVYSQNANAIVNTDLTLTNVTANIVDVQKGSVTLSTAGEGVTEIETLKTGDKVKVAMIADGTATDALNGDAEAFRSNVKVGFEKDFNFEAVEGKMNAGEVVGDVTFKLDKEGNVIKDSVKEAPHEGNAGVTHNANIALMAWRAETNDMNKRMGELRNANGEHGVWARMVGGEDEFKNAEYEYTQYQLGYDEKLSVDPSWTVGVALSYTDGESNFGKGSGENTHKGLSVYGSKLNDDGSFVDLIAKYSRLEHDLTVDGDEGDYSTNGYSVSAEYGKRFQQGNGMWIEPQVELTYGKVKSAEYKLGQKTVAQDAMESLVGRVGFSLGKDISKGNVYARASYLYDFEGETNMAFTNGATREFAYDLGGGWWEVGVGANINLSKATYIYADVEKTFGGEVDTNWQWNLGVRYSF